ncbi:MAG TPA: transporter associated domain-containing protein, partial [Burkholderiaceae bacterium]|nr:transporter associated domain-containing protein [Burkholderiaceae bacterium]
LTEQLGRVPKRGDAVEIDDLRLEVLRADARQVHLVQVTRLHRAVTEEFAHSDAELRRMHA